MVAQVNAVRQAKIAAYSRAHARSLISLSKRACSNWSGCRRLCSVRPWMSESARPMLTSGNSAGTSFSFQKMSKGLPLLSPQIGFKLGGKTLADALSRRHSCVNTPPDNVAILVVFGAYFHWAPPRLRMNLSSSLGEMRTQRALSLMAFNLPSLILRSTVLTLTLSLLAASLLVSRFSRMPLRLEVWRVAPKKRP